MVGCATTDASASAPTSGFNLLGIVQVENAAYAPTKATEPTIAEGQLGNNDNPTGRKVKLLWGLITYTDY